MLVVDSVLVEPIVDGGFEVDMVSEVAWPGWGDKEVLFVGNRVVDVKLFASSFIVLCDESKVVDSLCVSKDILLVRVAACLSLENNILFNN